MSQVELIPLPKIVDDRGNLTFLEKGVGCPFRPARIFWTFNVPGGSVRGGHAYKTQEEFIVAINGAFDVVLVDEKGAETRYRLDRGDRGLYVPPRHWRRMEAFSTNGMGLHLMSGAFDPSDYVREDKWPLES